MENYPSFSYPESGDSSPRSREIEFENPPPSWEDQQPPSTNHKVKFMVSYNGKIQPRPYVNLLAYVGGETKILAVDCSVKFSTIQSKLAALVSPDATDASPFTFKYQLPGEDLDALISVTNDDDLEHMMHEHVRMCKGSSKPARLRLFLFPDQRRQSNRGGGSGFSSISSELGKVVVGGGGPDRDSKFVGSPDFQNQNAVVADPPLAAPVPVHNNVDFLFGLENVPVQSSVPVQIREPIPEPKSVHELNRVQIQSQELPNFQQQYPQNNDENFTDPYPKTPSPANIPMNVQIPAGYWQQNHQPPSQPQFLQHQQIHQQPPVYMMQAPPQGNFYQAPVGVQMQPNQGYYQVQRMPSDPAFRAQTVYSMPAQSAVSAAAQVMPGMMEESAGYAQVAYDSATGRQVYYGAPPQVGVGMTASGEMSGNSGDGKVVQKVAPFSGGV